MRVCVPSFSGNYTYTRLFANTDTHTFVSFTDINRIHCIHFRAKLAWESYESNVTTQLWL